uniref:Uncharacterized protein n=1 Tax=Glossina austeni TaxID=7395 RepID=A0A1A9UGW1_GLOAU
MCSQRHAIWQQSSKNKTTHKVIRQGAKKKKIKEMKYNKQRLLQFKLCLPTVDTSNSSNNRRNTMESSYLPTVEDVLVLIAERYKCNDKASTHVITYNFMYWTHEMSPLCNVLVQDVTEWMKKCECRLSHISQSALAAHSAIKHFCHILQQVKFRISHYPLYKKGNK